MKGEHSGKACCSENASLAIATVPKQPLGELFDLKTALKKGTLFKNLDMPFFMGGEDCGQ
jgi:hypothetical protein